MDKKYQIGNFIMELRLEKGFTQKELADRLNVSNRAVSSWETGAALPRLALMEQLAALLEVSSAEILAGERLAGLDQSLEQRKKTYRLVRERVFSRCESCQHTKPLLYWPNRFWVCPKCRAGLQVVPKKRPPYMLAAAITSLIFVIVLHFLPRASRFEASPNIFPAKAPVTVHEFFSNSAEWCCAYRKDSAQYFLEIVFYVLAFLSIVILSFFLVSALLSRIFCKVEITSYPYPDSQNFDL